MKERRKIKNYFLKPKTQIKYLSLITGSVLLITLSFAYIVYNTVSENFSMFIEYMSFSAEAQKVLKDEWKMTTLVLASFSFGMILLSSVLTLFLLHKMIGPITRFIEYIQNYSQKKYHDQFKMRPNDEFHELEGAINDFFDGIRKDFSSFIQQIDPLIIQDKKTEFQSKKEQMNKYLN